MLLATPLVCVCVYVTTQTHITKWSTNRQTKFKKETDCCTCQTTHKTQNCTQTEKGGKIKVKKKSPANNDRLLYLPKEKPTAAKTTHTHTTKKKKRWSIVGNGLVYASWSTAKKKKTFRKEKLKSCRKNNVIARYRQRTKTPGKRKPSPNSSFWPFYTATLIREHRQQKKKSLRLWPL